MLRFYDTAAGAVIDFVPRDEGAVSMYVCGPTVYGPPHIGHGRAALVYDVLRRYLEWLGFEVRHVSNITDIDDRIIARANAEGRPWREIAAECDAEYWQAMDALGVQRPHEIPHATAYVAQMITLISELIAHGNAYETADGVYLESSTVASYGLLTHQSLDDLRAGARVDVVEDKRSHMDFALWKRAKPDEPSWPSPFGDGRPGWHTECVVMSLELLGQGFDIHGGGLDLVFPHHENERAQAVALGLHFAAHWVHNGFVTASGEKMSKSLDNYRTLTELVATVDPRSYRLLVLRSKYRSPLEATDDLFEEAATAIGRLDALARRFAQVAVSESEAAGALRSAFIAAMDDDLDTPLAVSRLFEALRSANSLGDAGDESAAAALAAMVLELFAALGLEPADVAEEVPEVVNSLVREMDQARSDREFARADQIRAELEAEGWRVENTAEGTRIHRADF
ncbi:MAG TPA: cysteine--tRNA ligase [Acidimicrobiales bacterium]